MKRTLLFMALAMSLSSVYAQQAYFKCDFTTGIPVEMGLFDLDGNEPSVDMKNLGFEIGVPWVVAEPNGDGNNAACSTSWYKKAGTSNDWMVTPAINVTSDRAVVRWRAKAGDSEYRDGYMVLISEKGGDPENFDIENPIFTVNSEKDEWQDREVSLETYEGKQIWVAFVNNSKDKATLYIDDIMIGVPSALEIKSNISRVINETGLFTVSANITNTSSDPVNGFKIKYQFDNGEIISEDISKTVNAGRTILVEFTTPVYIAKNQTMDYTMWVETGEDVSEDTGKVSAYLRRVVAEEVTGTWCGYCVRGMVAMSDMKEYYGDSFLGIAVHASSNSWEDPMDMSDYTDWLFSKFNISGYPHVVVNRQITYKGDPNNLYSYYKKALEKENYTGLDLEAAVNIENRVINATTTLFSSKDISDANLRLAYVIIENEVHGPDAYDEAGNLLPSNGWEQSNYYAGGSMGEMGGFEDMPSIISGYDMWYQDVARYISPGFNGLEGSVPTSIIEGIPVVHEEVIELPSTILNDSNTDLAVILINGKTDEILNAEVIPLREFFESSVKKIESSESKFFLHKIGNGVRISSNEPLAAVDIYSLNGSIVSSITPDGKEAVWETASLDGFYIIKATSVSGKTFTKKILL